MRERACSRRAFEPLEDLLAAGERGLFTELNGPNQRHILETLAQGVAQQVLTFLKNFGDGFFEESFQTALFDDCHGGKLRKQDRQVKCGGERKRHCTVITRLVSRTDLAT